MPTRLSSKQDVYVEAGVAVQGSAQGSMTPYLPCLLECPVNELAALPEDQPLLVFLCATHSNVATKEGQKASLIEA